MKGYVDKEDCVGCGMCAGACPDGFRMGDDGLAHTKADTVPAAAEATAKEAADSCPVSAITVGNSLA